IRVEGSEQDRPAARRRRERNLIDLHFAWDAGTRPHDDVVGSCPIDLCSGHADPGAPSGIERLETRQLCSEGAFAAYRRARINHNLRRVILAGADDQVEYAVTVDIAHCD